MAVGFIITNPKWSLNLSKQRETRKRGLWKLGLLSPFAYTLCWPHKKSGSSVQQKTVAIDISGGSWSHTLCQSNGRRHCSSMEAQQLFYSKRNGVVVAMVAVVVEGIRWCGASTANIVFLEALKRGFKWQEKRAMDIKRSLKKQHEWSGISGAHIKRACSPPPYTHQSQHQMSWTWPGDLQAFWHWTPSG